MVGNAGDDAVPVGDMAPERFPVVRPDRLHLDL